MPARIVGMLGVTPPQSSSTLLVIEGDVSPAYIVEHARAHEAAGYDLALVGYTSSSAEGFLVAMHAAAHTERLGYFIAHRPGFVAPTLFARKVATFDHLTGGRVALHIITGKTDAEQEGDGDFTPKAERYRRAEEYLHLVKKTWAATEPFDFEGAFYRVRGAHSDVRPVQQPHPQIMFGGASEGALDMGAAECDVFGIYAEPRATTAERIAEFRARAAGFGRSVGFNMSVRPIIAPTEGEAWDKAHRILEGMTGHKLGWSRQESEGVRAPVDNAGKRQFAFALEKEVHDERLWMGITKATGALGNTSCLVGTPEQVADAVLGYYRLGVESFLMRGFDPLNDVADYGRELIPRIKAGALEIDRQAAA
ncbi:MAG: LLM class flavin-dependent oxidoreductase [Alphaproteobacteria bacterium]|nr:LLM class flavin-dependent oxidoreductase [Alphaproteobacteria bacterium]MCB9929727.1 LLM class flavin-dependent oxidoreductase [Alphaproteobacteria bacterium]